MLLEYDPPPVLSEVLESAVVGFVEVLQHTPRSITSSEQSPDMVPPDEAEVDDIAEIAVVDIVGRTALVVNVRSAP